MKAEVVNRIGGTRKCLKDLLPLETPLAVYVEVTTACNFKCSYCPRGVANASGIPVKSKSMSLENLCACVDSLRKFPDRLKAFVFVGQGEPLLNPRIADMVAYAKKAEIADRVEVVTNGSMLTEEVSDGLIASDLDYLRISLQGLTAEDYLKTSGVNIRYEQFVSQVRYFYENKRNTRLYIKYLDIHAADERARGRFYEIYGDICDEISVNYLIPIYKDVDFSKFNKDFKHRVHGGEIAEKIKVCPKPFYMFQIKVDGTVIPCCAETPPMDIGNAFKRELTELWKDEQRKFQLLQLEKGRDAVPECRGCQFPAHHTQPEDNIDGFADEILCRFHVTTPLDCN